MTPNKKHAVGAEIEAYCTKCKIDRLHAIETLKSDGNINKVICRTCEGIHLFRLPKGDGTQAVKKKASPRRKKGSVVLTDEEISHGRAYAMHGTFEAGEIIKHTRFGPGRVLDIRPGKMMEVGFEQGTKILVFGRPKAS